MNKKEIEEKVRNGESLKCYDLRGANLRDANLENANLKNANLQDANLQYANLQDANLYTANLQNANLQYANLQSVDLQYAKLQYANLQNAILSCANFYRANLENANLKDANLKDANLTNTNLTNTNLSNVKGLLNQKEWINKIFKKTSGGFIVYKAFGNTHYEIPEYWEIEEGKYIEEEVNTNRTTDCGCGVNFATKEWIREEFIDENIDIWECLLEFEDLINTCVPYNTNGKARCGRLKLLRKVQ